MTSVTDGGSRSDQDAAKALQRSASTVGRPPSAGMPPDIERRMEIRDPYLRLKFLCADYAALEALRPFARGDALDQIERSLADMRARIAVIEDSFYAVR